MRIGIDIDGVLTNDDDYILDTATKFCLANHLSHYVNPYEYELRKKFNWDKATQDKYRTEYFWNYVINEPPRKYAREVIKQLKDEGNQIYIITSRHLSMDNSLEGAQMRAEIKKWLTNHQIVYDEIYFSSDKTVEINNLKIDVMIEDSPETIPIFANYTHIFCFDCRYNRNLICSNMTRVFSWYDILMKLKDRQLKR